MTIIAQRTYTFLREPLNPVKGLHFYDLDYLGVLEVKGLKAKEFLQGQLSADIDEVNENTIRQAALCNLKGRIKALMDVVFLNDHFLLILPKDLREETLKSLGMAARLSRVTVEINNDYHCVGIIPSKSTDSAAFLPEVPYHLIPFKGHPCYALELPVYLLLCTESFKATLPLEGSLSWHAQQLRRKSVEIYPESSGLFLPHRLDLHLKGYLNFNKGCYKGQEIIARMHFRSKPKHSLEIFQIRSTHPLKPGMQIINPENKETVGELIDFCPLEKDVYLIAISIIFEHPKRIVFAEIENARPILLENINFTEPHA